MEFMFADAVLIVNVFLEEGTHFVRVGYITSSAQGFVMNSTTRKSDLVNFTLHAASVQETKLLKSNMKKAELEKRMKRVKNFCRKENGWRNKSSSYDEGDALLRIIL